MPIYLKDGAVSASGDGIKRVVDNYYADATDNMYGIRGEIAQYMLCPLNKNNTHPYTGVIHTDTNTAYIECAECSALEAVGKDYAFAEVSVDMTGWRGHDPGKVADPDREVPSEEESSSEEEVEYTVTFDLQGHGSPQPEQQKVKKGEYAKVPTPAPTAATYSFGGWYTEPGCTNEYIFTTPVTANTTLYAKWVGINQGHVWPYADDMSWWDPDKFTHDSEVSDKDISDTYNNKWIVLNAPSGIFTSKLGSQFVYVAVNGDQKIYLYDAITPEYYSAKHSQWLIHLTGNKFTEDISDYDDDKSITVKLLTNGDLVEFTDSRTGKRYLYVYWHSQGTNVNISVKDIRNYTNHPSNMYRVNPVAEAL